MPLSAKNQTIRRVKNLHMLLSGALRRFKLGWVIDATAYGPFTTKIVCRGGNPLS